MKLLYYSLIALSIVFLSACSSSGSSGEEDIGDVRPTLRLNFDKFISSRTSINGETGEVTCSATDEILVFVHETGSQPVTVAEWLKCRHKFITDNNNCRHNRFSEITGTSAPLTLNPGKTYTWYVMYPYTEAVKSPMGHGTIVVTDQEQIGNQNTSQMSKHAIMTGVKLDAKSEQEIAISLKQRMTFMHFKVQNEKNEEFVPKYLELSTEGNPPATLRGEFQVDFKNGLTAIQTQNKLRLNLQNMDAVPVGGHMDVYAIMAPFSLKTNDVFNVQVVTDISNTTQTTQIRENKNFEAGKFYTTNVKVTSLSVYANINPWEVQEEMEEDLHLDDK